MIMSCIPAEFTKPVCYTFAGASDALLDLKLAARVAGVCGLEHSALRVDKDFIAGYSNTWIKPCYPRTVVPEPWTPTRYS